MLFNSWPFLIGFLPVSLLGYYLLGSRSALGATTFLALSSLLFYGLGDPNHVPLLISSIAFNFAIGHLLLRSKSRLLLTAAILGNLGTLVYFKYSRFLIENINTLLGTELDWPHTDLPIGISFYTFTQIAFLVDTYRRQVNSLRMDHYALFVTYYPHLIAGPIIHHTDVMPQFRQREAFRFHTESFTIGLSILIIGLFKKVVIADGIAVYVPAAFDAPNHAAAVSFSTAWTGALAYTFQLYFDFSGYCDMAIGISKMFNIRLPINFNSPYKATSIVDFWRRWHMTLSRFLRDYLYIPLGGNRHGAARRYVNLLATMVIGGLWHGANWTFIVWGTLHGVYLLINHAWIDWTHNNGPAKKPSALGQLAGWILTFLSIVIAWVFFRSTSLETAFNIVSAMFGANGVAFDFTALPWLACVFTIALAFPNTQEIMTHYRPALGSFPPRAIEFHFNLKWMVVLITLGSMALVSMDRPSEFLYFQF